MHMTLAVMGVVMVVGLAGVRLTWAEPEIAAYEEGIQLVKKGSFREAVAAFDKALRLNPDFAEAYGGRGNVYAALAQYEQALKDYDEAIRLDSAYVEAYFNRGNVYSGLVQHERALKDYSAVIRLNPDLAEAYHNRALAYLILGRGEAAADARAYLQRKGWRQKKSLYMVLVGHFGDRQARREAEARQILDEAVTQCDTTAWPYPLVRYLRREINAKTLLATVTGTDKQTEALTYLGLDFARSGQRQYALPYLQWVKNGGNKKFVEYRFAVAELGRLESLPPAQPQTVP